MSTQQLSIAEELAAAVAGLDAARGRYVQSRLDYEAAQHKADALELRAMESQAGKCYRHITTEDVIRVCGATCVKIHYNAPMSFVPANSIYWPDWREIPAAEFEARAREVLSEYHRMMLGREMPSGDTPR